MTMESDLLLSGMLRTLRSTLHACAEPAGEETATAGVITEFLSAYEPDEIVTDLGGHGVAAVFEGDAPGPTVLVRADLDGLPLEEGRCAHLCGHDGHMAIVAGLAPWLHSERPARGRVVLLFQPAEESGFGAHRVVADPQFAKIRPDYAFALHNLPGYTKNTIVCRNNTFASASVGMRVELEGVASHAAEPELARSPAGALRHLLRELPRCTDLENEPYRLVTVTHLRMGHESFGITPGSGTLLATLRSATGPGLEQLCREAEAIAREAADASELAVEIAWEEHFPATINDDELVGLLREACALEAIELAERELPFRWSEDFGHFTTVCPTLFFGLGIGSTAAGLHQPDYRFPDEVIGTGMRAFARVVSLVLERAGDAPSSRLPLEHAHTTP